MSSGPATGNTAVVISGSHLTGATAVMFGSTAAKSFDVSSDSLIVAVTDASAAGTVDVSVTTPGGTDTLNAAFTYVLAPQTVSWSPTTVVTAAQSPLTPSTRASALGGATITYSVLPGFTTAACTVDSSTGVLTYRGAGSCTVRASAGATGTYDAGSIDVAFASSLASQSITASASPSSVSVGQSSTLSASGAIGSGAVTWTVVSGSSACSLSGTTVSARAAGSCVIRASVAADETYAADTDDVTITVTGGRTSGDGGSGGGGSGGGSSGSSVVVGSSLQSPVVAVVSGPGLPPIVPVPPVVVPQPAQGSALVGGQQAGVSVTQNRSGMTVAVAGTPVGFTLGSTGGNGVRATTGGGFVTGVPTPFTAQGFAPGSAVTVYAMSTPVLVASTVADGQGRVDGLITLPASLGTGRHTLVVSGYLAGGTAVSSYVGISTTSAASTVVRRVFFPVASSELTDGMKARLAQLAASMRGRAPATVTVGVVRGGNPTRAEQALAVARARAVAAYLKAKGMPGTVRIGASIPTTLTTWEARRVDVAVTR